MNQSKKGLLIKAEQITDKIHRDGFLTQNIMHHQIMNFNEKTLKDLTDSFIIPSAAGMNKFCAECGYANVEMQPLCPQCGYDLKID